MPHLCFTVTTGCPHAASGCTTVETCKGLSGKQFESLRRRGVRGLFPCLLRSLSVSPSVSIRLCFCLRLLEPVFICRCRVLLSSSLPLFLSSSLSPLLPFSLPPFPSSLLSLFLALSYFTPFLPSWIFAVLILTPSFPTAVLVAVVTLRILQAKCSI